MAILLRWGLLGRTLSIRISAYNRLSRSLTIGRFLRGLMGRIVWLSTSRRHRPGRRCARSEMLGLAALFIEGALALPDLLSVQIIMGALAASGRIRQARDLQPPLTR
jgi:hypothetical protein